MWTYFFFQAELIEICRLVAESKLSEGKHQEMLPAAQFCLRCSFDVHGHYSVQLVPAFLLLAEANMGKSWAQNCTHSPFIYRWMLEHLCFCAFSFIVRLG